MSREVTAEEVRRLRHIERAARAFLAAAYLESMTKAPDYIKAKRALRAALKEPA